MNLINFKKRNKKGFLLANETLKIIVAVICIIFLIYFLSMIYLAKSGERKRVEAEDTLDRINEIINGLNLGEDEIQGIGAPKGWHLFSFISSPKPNSCTGQNCLCICGKALNINGQFDRQAKKCDDSGVCFGVRGLRAPELDIKIMGGNSLVFVEIEKTSQGIFIKQVI